MRQRPEEQAQRAIVSYIETVCPHVLVWACPNGSRRSAGGRATNAVPGLRKGAPDLIIALPNGRTLHLEVKAPKGHASLEQISFHGRLNALGHECAVVRSIDDVRRAFSVLGIETREIE